MIWKKVKKRSSFTALLLGTLLFQVTAHNAQSAPCDLVEGALLERYVHTLRWQHGEQTSLTIFTNHSMLRQLNHQLNQWTRGSEYLSSLTHFLFQYELKQQLSSHGIQIQNLKVPYFKSTEVQLSVPINRQHLVLEALNQTKNKLARRTWEAIFNVQSESAVLAVQIENPNSPISRSGEFAFLNSSRYLNPLTPEEFQILKQHLRKNYSKPSFIQALQKAYGMGLGFQLTDAAFAARLNSQRQGNIIRATQFNFQHFASVLRGAIAQHNRLDWLFSKKPPDQIKKIFQTIRANLGKVSPAGWTAGMKELAQNHPKRHSLTAAQVLLELERDLSRYQRTINALDFMPAEWTAQEEGIGERFAELGNAQGVIFFDRRGLGAENLLHFQEEIPHIKRQLQRIEDLIATYIQASPTSDSKPQIREAIEHELLLLESSRHQILSASNDTLQGSKRYIREIMNRLNIRAEDYALFAAGDDMLLKFSGPPIKWTSVIKAFTQDDSFLSDHRTVIAYGANLPADLSLNGARRTVAQSAEVAKAIELLELPYDTLSRLLDYEKREIAIYRIDDQQNLQPIPLAHRNAMQQMTPSWSLSFPE